MLFATEALWHQLLKILFEKIVCESFIKTGKTVTSDQTFG